MKRLLAVLLLVVCVPAMGAVIVMPSDEQLVDKSDGIVVGTIVGSWPEMLPDKSIRTVYSMVIGESIRGFEAGDLIEFREWGGVVDGRVTHVSGAPVYEVGQRYLVFLHAWGDTFTTVDLGVGRFRFAGAKGDTLLVRNLEEILAWNPILEPHVEVPREAEAFLAFVRRRAAESELSASASATATDSPAPTSVGTLNTNTAVAFGNLQWNSSSIVNYSISATLDTTGQMNLEDFIDIVILDSSTCNPEGGECIAGTFAGTGTVATAFTSGFIESDRIDIVDSDIVIQNGVSSTNTSQTEYNAILTHEIGHTLGFRHPNQNKYSLEGTSCTAPLPCSACNNTTDKAVMCSILQAGTDGTLEAWDIAARTNNYANSSSFDSNYLTWAAGLELPFHRDAPTTAWRINTALASACTAPSINSGPVAVPTAVIFGVSSQLSISASGTSLNYQWYRGASGVTTNPVAGGVSAMIAVTPAVTSTYWVRISNTCGSIDSAAVTVTVEKGTDFNSDGKADILWRHYGGGDNAVWFLNGTSFVGASGLPGVTDTDWILSGTGDFNGDLKSDLVWRHRGNGSNAVWFMDGTTFIGAASLPGVGDNSWWIAGVADFNRDGSSDLLWHNRTSGAAAIWLFSGTNFITAVSLPGVTDVTWRLVGTADMSGDEKPDLVWRNFQSGANAVWVLDGSSFVTAISLIGVTDTLWQIQGLTDMNGDGHTDILWRHGGNGGNGGNAVWFMNGTNFSGAASLPGVLDLNWVMSGPR